MNDVVFAGKYSDFILKEEQFAKCLKIVVPKKDGCRIDIKAQKLFCRAGGYAVIPPLSPCRIIADGCDLIACVEQPLMPSQTKVCTADDEGLGMLHAVEQAAIYIGRDGGVLAALGALIVSYITELYDRDEQPVVKLLKQEIENGVSDCAFAVETAIRKLPLNYDYVRKLFKKQVGLTPHEYLLQLRMQRARELICSGVTNKYSAYSVSQIAEACGFAEPLYFSRVFKNYFGVSPANYPRGNK